jgi:hypothetical protein
MHLIIKLFILWCPIIYFLFWYYHDIFLCVTNIMSSFQKSTMSPFFFLNSSIIFNTILTKVYCNMDNEKIEMFNV